MIAPTADAKIPSPPNNGPPPRLPSKLGSFNRSVLRNATNTVTSTADQIAMMIAALPDFAFGVPSAISCFGLNRRALHPIISLLFQFKRQLLPAFLHDLAAGQNVYKIRLDVVQKTLIVSNQDDRILA